MKKLRKRFLLPVVLWLMALLLGLLPASALATHTSIELLGAAWNHTDIMVRVNMGQGVDPDVAAAVTGAIADWNSAISTLGNASNGGALADFGLNVISSGSADITLVLQKGKNPLDPTVGLARWWVRGDGSFFKVQIKLMGQEMGDPYSATLVRTVTRHELGHALGLGHANFEDDLMYPILVLGAPISDCDKAAFATVHDWYGGSFSAPTAPSESCD